MSLHKFQMFLYATHDGLYEEPFLLWRSDSMTDHWCTLVGPVTVECEVPEHFDPRPQQIKSLEEERETLRAELGKKLTDIERRINELQAIEHTPVEDSIPSGSVPF
jgi:hypothetical protein